MHAAALTLLLFSVGLCDDCQTGGRCKHVRRHSRTEGHRGQPQTCYAPRYGCYYSNNRHMNRYPAFHGVYYRRPYNYRNLFDYPWHARLHEPTSLFSYNVPDEEVVEPKMPSLPVPPKEARAPARNKTVNTEGDEPADAEKPERLSRLAPIPTVMPVRIVPDADAVEQSEDE